MLQRSRIYFLVLLLLIFGQIACAPGLGSQLSIAVPEAAVQKEFIETAGQAVIVPVQISAVQDQRASTFIGAINGRSLLPEGSIEAAVKTMLENECKERGYSVSKVAETNISAEVREWFVDITSKFPASTAVARATVVVKVEVPATGKRFYAEYSGTTELKHPLLNQARIEGQLMKAMENAVKTAFSDPRLTVIL